MALYRKKPVVIEAVQITAADYNGSSFDGSPFTGTPDWLIAACATGVLTIHPDDLDYAMWAVKTLEGTTIGGPGDWLIRGVDGELYFCTPRIFASTYEAVEPDGRDHQRPTANPVIPFDGVDHQEIQSVSGHDAQDEQGRG